MTLASMRRLIDSDRSAAVSLLVPHPCSCTRGLSVGAFSSVRRARRLRIANGHAGCRMSRFTRGRWVSVGRTSQLSAPVNNVAVCERSTTDGTLLGPGTRPVSIHKVLRLCQAGSLFSPRLDRKQGLPPRGVPSKQGEPWVPGPTRDPWGFLGKGSAHLVVGPLEKNRRNRGPLMFAPQGVAVLQGGKSVPVAPGPHNKDSSSGVRQQAGGPMGSWHQPGTHRVPPQRRRNDPRFVLGRLARGELPANPTPSRAVHLDDRSKMT